MKVWRPDEQELRQRTESATASLARLRQEREALDRQIEAFEAYEPGFPG